MKYFVFLLVPFVGLYSSTLFATSLKSQELKRKIEILEGFGKDFKRVLEDSKNDKGLKLRFQTLNYMVELFTKVGDLEKIEDPEVIRSGISSITKTILLTFPDEELSNFFDSEKYKRENVKEPPFDMEKCKKIMDSSQPSENHAGDETLFKKENGIMKDDKPIKENKDDDRDFSSMLVHAEMLFYSKKELYKALSICDEIIGSSSEFADKAKELSSKILEYQKTQVKLLLGKAKSLVEKESKYSEAISILDTLIKDYYVNWKTKPLQSEVESILSDYKQYGSAREREVQTGAIKELEVRYNEALNILETGKSEKELSLAISKFRSLEKTSFSATAKSKIKEAVEKIVQSLREEAAKFLLISQREGDKSVKVKNLKKSREILMRITSLYPENSQNEKIKRNLEKVNREIEKANGG